MLYLKKNSLKLIIPLVVFCNAYPLTIQNNITSTFVRTKAVFSTIKTYIQKIKHSVIHTCTKKYNAWFKTKTVSVSSRQAKKLLFIDLLFSGELIEKMFMYIDHPYFPTAEWSFSTFKKFWPWHRDYTFLIPSLDNNIEESEFIKKLDFDIMRAMERNHITSQSYITKYIDAQSLEILKKYNEQCIQLQNNCDLDAFLNEINRLRNRVIKNGRKTVLIDNICLAIAEKVYLDPVTILLNTVKHAPTLKEAHAALLAIQSYVAEQSQQDLAKASKEKRITRQLESMKKNMLKN